MKKVLLVDDEVDFANLMGQRIESWGYEVMFAYNGNDAVNMVRDQKPDAVILDYMMPDMDGIATLRSIRKFNRGIPVIMFTAYPSEKGMIDTDRLDVMAFIPKISANADSKEAVKTVLDMVFEKKRAKK